MKRTGKIGLLLAIVCLLGCLMPRVNAAGSDLTVTSGCHSIDAALPLAPQEQLLATSKAVIAYELNSDTLVYAWNPDERIYPSSMVKLMTALVALEYGTLTDTVTVTREALAQVAPGALVMGLQSGEVLTLEQLLYCMMVASANDAAAVIAQYVGGSQASFLSLMNRKAEALGCRDTNYSNVHGLHDENTYTTARDICRILRYALENEDFKAMFTAKSYTVPETNMSDARELFTTNNLMLEGGYYDKRVTGGKTGATDAAGRCLAVTAEQGDMNLLCIVMGAQPTYQEDGTAITRYGSFEEMGQLLDHCFSKYAFRQIFYADQVLTQLPVINGDNHVAVQPNSSFSVVLPVELNSKALTWQYDAAASNITAPVEAGQRLTSVQVWCGLVCVGQTELFAIHSVGQENSPVMPVRPSQMDDRGSWEGLLLVLGVVGIIVILAAAVMFVPRLVRRAAVRARRRRRRINRRRSR